MGKYSELSHKERSEVALAPRLAEVPYSSVNLDVLSAGGRRLEARSYLTDGFGQRQLIEGHRSGWLPMRDVANVWQPSRLKGIVVPTGMGLPFLSAGQVFESSPVVRKWLSPSHVKDAAERAVTADMILMSCSGRVGRITAVYPHHERITVTHDLLRIVPKTDLDRGWLYAYMRTEVFQAVAQSAQYGHMIKHLEPEHVQDMPVVMPAPSVRAEIGGLALRAIELRIEAKQSQAKADEAYEALINPSGAPIAQVVSHAVPLQRLLTSRMRLDAEFARSDVIEIEDLVRAASTQPVQALEDVTAGVRLGSRFKRFFGSEGTPYRSASELLDLNAPITKRIYAALVPNSAQYLLQSGWIIMARSGQVYGLNGRSMLVTDAHAGIFGSDDLITIVPDPSVIPTGYLLTVLNNGKYGRPLVIRHAYGTSIPHLDPIDVRTIPIPRFDRATEDEIGMWTTEAATLAADADKLENEATARAEGVVQQLLRTPTTLGSAR